MRVIKRILLGFLILFLLAVAGFAGLAGFFACKADGFQSFSEMIESDDINFHLTIYFAHDSATKLSGSVDALKRNCDYKIVIDSSNLELYKDSLDKLIKEPSIQYGQETRLNCRIYYVFESVLHRKLYEVALWGSGGSVYVNGVAVKEADIYYDMILPFLPKDEADELRTLVADMRQERG